MTLSRPIPKALLPHTVTLKKPRESDTVFADEYEEIILHNVRVEQNEKVRTARTSETRTRGARMYFDCANSAPADIEFKTEQLVLFYGDVYKIEAVKAVMAADKVHHYKIDLI